VDIPVDVLFGQHGGASRTVLGNAHANSLQTHSLLCPGDHKPYVHKRRTILFQSWPVQSWPVPVPQAWPELVTALRAKGSNEEI
jgi:hypothetical protein